MARSVCLCQFSTLLFLDLKEEEGRGWEPHACSRKKKKFLLLLFSGLQDGMSCYRRRKEGAGRKED